MKYLVTRKQKYCFVLNRVSDLRPIIISGVKVLDFRFIWFSANHFIEPCQKQDVWLEKK